MAATTGSETATKMVDEGKPRPVINLFKADIALRSLVFFTTLAAPVLMFTGNQEVVVNIPLLPYPLTLDAKFNYSPAFIYFVAASFLSCLYSLLTVVASGLSIAKPLPSANLLLVLASFDALMLGVVASATGAGAGVAYIGLKGDSHTGWMKVCNIYGKFCRHIGISILLSLLAAVILVLLVIISTFSLHRRSR